MTISYPRFEEIAVNSHFPPAVARLHFTVRFPKAPRRGGFVLHTMKRRELPSSEYLNECFEYNPNTGELRWRVRPLHHFKTKRAWAITSTRDAGRIAGTKAFQNYNRSVPHSIQVRADYHTCGAHNVAYVMMTGNPIPPDRLVDHEDGNPFNNAWENLRLASPHQNGGNSCNRRRRKYKLPKGVSIERDGRFRARIGGRIRIFLGIFNTPKEAHLAYCAAAERMYGCFARFE